jgi:hypothetical protein
VDYTLLLELGLFFKIKTVEKGLGVLISNDLEFKKNIELITSKANRVLFTINMVLASAF